jgi:hypothetical protein
LSWTFDPKNKNLEIKSYNIYRKSVTTGEETYSLVGTVDGSKHIFHDRNLPYQYIYSYIVTSVESGGHQSEPSMAVQNEIL